MTKLVGIYGIRNLNTGWTYVGQSVNINRRLIRHKSSLKHNKHYNAYLQNSYNKHGMQSFAFVVLETCEKSELSQKEQWWIDNETSTYNTDTSVLSKFGTNNPFFGQKHTKVTKQKMSNSRKGKYAGSENPNFGNKNNREVRRKMAIRRARKLTPDNVTNIRKKLANGMKHKEIAMEFNVSRTIVTRIKSGARYALVGEQL